jgi:hypothetical protein
MCLIVRYGGSDSLESQKITYKVYLLESKLYYVLTSIVFKESVTLYYVKISLNGEVSCVIEIIKSKCSKVVNVKRLKTKGYMF